MTIESKNNFDLVQAKTLAARIRRNATEMVSIQGFGYLGQALSTADALSVLFGSGFIRPGWDRFVLSPGHYVTAFYGVAVEMGIIAREHCADYGSDGAVLETISTERTPGLDITCGSLGQGISGGIGLALAAKLDAEDRQVFVLSSDGEMEEGQTWEAAMFASHHKVDNLTVLIDANDSQVDGPVSGVTTIEPIPDKWKAFGWHVSHVDGHNLEELYAAFKDKALGKPHVIIARTHVTGNIKAIPDTADGHFVKLNPEMTKAIIEELGV